MEPSTNTPIPNRPEAQRVESMFERVAGRYDLANDILSLGIHRLWRKRLVKLAALRPGNRVLDCATGTGDLAIEFKRALGSKGEVIGTDFCEGMLNLAPSKAKRSELQIHFEIQDVTALKYPDQQFDVVSISFGIRNVERPDQALREMLRVLKPGGRLMILEFGQPNSKLFGSAYKFYSKNFLPRIGGWITGQQSAYEYLERSSALFPSGQDFIRLVRSLSDKVETAEVHPLSFGIAYLYKIVKQK